MNGLFGGSGFPMGVGNSTVPLHLIECKTVDDMILYTQQWQDGIKDQVAIVTQLLPPLCSIIYEHVSIDKWNELDAQWGQTDPGKRQQLLLRIQLETPTHPMSFTITRHSTITPHSSRSDVHSWILNCGRDALDTSNRAEKRAKFLNRMLVVFGNLSPDRGLIRCVDPKLRTKTVEEWMRVHYNRLARHDPGLLGDMTKLWRIHLCEQDKPVVWEWIDRALELL